MEADDLQALIEATANLGSGTPTWALFVSAGAIIIAAVFGAIWQRRIARQTLTYNTIVEQMWDKDYIEKRNQFIGTLKKDGGEELTRLAGKEAETEDVAEAIRLTLNNYELTAIAIFKGVLDEGMGRHKFLRHR